LKKKKIQNILKNNHKKMLENQIQKSILDYLAYKKNIYYFRAGSGSFKTEKGGYFKTGSKGCPDIVMSYHGQFVGLEVKTEKGKQSEYQKEAEKQIKKSGGFYYIVTSIDDVINCLKQIDNQLEI